MRINVSFCWQNKYKTLPVQSEFTCKTVECSQLQIKTERKKTIRTREFTISRRCKRSEGQCRILSYGVRCKRRHTAWHRNNGKWEPWKWTIKRRRKSDTVSEHPHRYGSRHWRNYYYESVAGHVQKRLLSRMVWINNLTAKSFHINALYRAGHRKRVTGIQKIFRRPQPRISPFRRVAALFLTTRR